MNKETIYQRRWWTLTVLCLSLLMISLDNTVLNVALPTLVRDLSASSSQLQWIVDSYVLVFAGLLLTAGNFGDRFGRRRALFAGYGVFGIASLLSAYSGSASELIASRALLGLGGALIMPATLSILTNVFPPKERPRAIALWAATFGLGIPIGPVLGGWLLEHFWWGSVFLINLPVIAIATVATIFVVPESKDPEQAALDPPGAILSIAGLAALLYAIIEAPNHGWTSVTTLLWFAGAIVLLTAFAIWEARTAKPMLDTRLFKNPRFSAASISVTLVFFALFGTIFFLTQYLQFVLGYTTLEAGVRTIPVALGILIAAPLSAKLAERFGAKLVVAGGLAIVSAGLLLLSTVTMSSGYELILMVLPIMGFGMGTAMAPATEAIMGAVPRSNAGVGSAVNDTTRQIGGALGVAILGSLLATDYSSAMEPAVQNLPAPAAGAASDSVGAALQVAQQIGGQPGLLLAETARSAFVDALGSTVLIGSGFALAGALVALVFLPAHGAEEEDEVETEVGSDVLHAEPVRFE